MSRPRRKPRPPGNVQMICTGRGGHNRVPLRTGQLVRVGDEVRLAWNTREGPLPVTLFASADGTETCEAKCGTCGRHLKRHDDWLARAALALAEHQGIAGDDNTPIVLDISLIERA